ncbi:hypothetical protein GS429_05990 [Natronorubrum sp. JWXQ-INN-674]|uniref:Uncharacterized protein n=1 Tax=Natronorubrum halalkaliphilum TaxID=2691917 RepID=A0A6B0VK98_9EURY|nr:MULTISPECIES: hypothetical protein [Natrialbaceae]MXV61623.1 hypothetical protein [Natronorubrum halalkaliphilum]
MDDDSDEDTLQEALDRAQDVMLPADDSDELQPNYPADYTPEERVEHVLRGEYPRWRSVEWITAAADTDSDVCWSVIQDRLGEGEVEISSEGVRRNRYHVYFEKVEKATERARERPRRLL